MNKRFNIFNVYFKAMLSVLQASLFCIHGQIHVEVLSGFLLEYVVPEKEKTVLDTQSQMNFVFHSKTVYLQHGRQM